MRERTKSGGASWPAMGVGGRAIVEDVDGRILLIRRSRDVKWDPGLWELPGGKVDHGETVEHALAREVREETGLEIEVGRPVHVGHFAKDPFWVTTVSFVCRAHGDDVRLSHEHEAFAWVEPPAVAALECTRPALEALDAHWTLTTAAPEPRRE